MKKLLASDSKADINKYRDQREDDSNENSDEDYSIGLDAIDVP